MTNPEDANEAYSYRDNWLYAIEEFNEDPEKYDYDSPMCFLRGLIESEREEFKKLLIEKCPRCHESFHEPWNTGTRLLHGTTVEELVDDYIKLCGHSFDEYIALRAREVELERRRKLNEKERA